MEILNWLWNAVVFISAVDGAISFTSRGAKAINYVTAINRGARIRPIIEATPQGISQTPLKVERLDNGIHYAPSIVQVRDTTPSGKILLPELRDVQTLLSPIKESIGGTLLSTAWIAAPSIMQQTLIADPNRVLYNTSPLHSAKFIDDPDSVKVLFFYKGQFWIGWQKSFMLGQLFHLDYDPRLPALPLIGARIPVATIKSNTQIAIVAPNDGDYSSIQSAINAVPPHSTIYVRSGVYKEFLHINKPVSIVGEGDKSGVVITSPGICAVWASAPNTALRNLTVRLMGNEGVVTSCIAVTNNSDLDIRDCTIVGNNTTYGMLIAGGASPTVVGCRIQGTKTGVMVDGAGGQLENNHFLENMYGVLICRDGNPIVQNNKFRCKVAGCKIFSSGRGRFIKNDIVGGSDACFVVQESGNPIVTDNYIRGGRIGVSVREQGKGEFRDNSISGSAEHNIQVLSGGNPKFYSNNIWGAAGCGVHVCEMGRGEFRSNVIFDNTISGVRVTDGGNPVVTENLIHDNKLLGLQVDQGGQGRYEHNQFRRNRQGNWKIHRDTSVLLSQNSSSDD